MSNLPNEFLIQKNLTSFSSTEREDIIRSIINNSLSDRQRQCLILNYFDGLSVSQIAKRLSLSPSTVSRHIKKAKLIIQKQIEYMGIKL